MKNLIITGISVLFLAAISLSSVSAAQRSISIDFNSKIKAAVKADSSRASYYLAKSKELASNQRLASAYAKCSEAKKLSASSANKYLKALEKSEQICNSNKPLAEYIGDTLSYTKKGEHLKTRIKKLDSMSAGLLEKTKVASTTTELKTAYIELSSNLKLMSKSLESYRVGKIQFRNENSILRSLRQG